MVNIKGGYILQPRCFDESDAAHLPPATREVWFYILRKVSHKDGDKLKRGQGLFTIPKIIEALSWSVGYRPMTYTKTQVAKALRRLREDHMLTTTKTTRGLIITVCNYSFYQDPANYEGHNEGSTKDQRKDLGGCTIDKNVNKEEVKDLPSSGDEEQEPFYITKKKRKLKGKRLQTFNLFWSAFKDSRGKAAAADAWLDIPVLTDTLVAEIVKGAESYAAIRGDIKDNGSTPKMAQGWLTDRRWEDGEDTFEQDEQIDHSILWGDV